MVERKCGQTIRLGNGITLTVISVGSNRVRLGIVAPKDVTVYRDELTKGQKP